MAATAKPTTTAASTNDKLTPADAKAIAQEGFIFGLPPVYIAQQADVMTNVGNPSREIISIDQKESAATR
jgi:hypothetical protein